MEEKWNQWKEIVNDNVNQGPMEWKEKVSGKATSSHK